MNLKRFLENAISGVVGAMLVVSVDYWIELDKSEQEKIAVACSLAGELRVVATSLRSIVDQDDGSGLAARVMLEKFASPAFFLRSPHWEDAVFINPSIARTSQQFFRSYNDTVQTVNANIWRADQDDKVLRKHADKVRDFYGIAKSIMMRFEDLCLDKPPHYVNDVLTEEEFNTRVSRVSSPKADLRD